MLTALDLLEIDKLVTDIEHKINNNIDFSGYVTVPCSRNCDKEEWIERYILELKNRQINVTENPNFYIHKICPVS